MDAFQKEQAVISIPEIRCYSDQIFLEVESRLELIFEHASQGSLT